VEGIGNIEYNARSGMLVVSGYTESATTWQPHTSHPRYVLSQTLTSLCCVSCSVWKHVNGQASVYSHMSQDPNTIIKQNVFTTTGVWFDDNKTVVTDSDGVMHVFVQTSSVHACLRSDVLSQTFRRHTK
jgi:hypothetical protein